MSIYQCIFFLMELFSFAIFIWVFYKFSMGVYLKTDHLIKEFCLQTKDFGWEQALRNSIESFVHAISGYILIFFLIFLLPVACIVLNDFMARVVGGTLSMSKFIAHVPEVAAVVANFYCNFWVSIGFFLHRLST